MLFRPTINVGKVIVVLQIHFNFEMDHAFHFDLNPDLDPPLSQRDLQPLTCRLFPAPFWASMPALWASRASLLASMTSEWASLPPLWLFMRLRIQILVSTLMGIRIITLVQIRILLPKLCGSGSTTQGNRKHYLLLNWLTFAYMDFPNYQGNCSCDETILAILVK